MSAENVELVQRLYAEGDLLRTTGEQIDRVFREDFDENFEFRLPADYPEGEPVFRGRAGIDELRDMLSEPGTSGTSSRSDFSMPMTW